MLIKFDFNNMMTDFIGEQGISVQDIEQVKEVAAAAFGNVTVINVMFMFVVMSCVTETGAVVWLIQKLLSLKFFAGKPWAFSSMYHT